MRERKEVCREERGWEEGHDSGRGRTWQVLVKLENRIHTRMCTNKGCETARAECSGINPSQVSSPKKAAIALFT